MREFARKEWIEACKFADLGQKSILEEVAFRLSKSDKGGKPTAVVFDLDSTLYEVAPRTHAIIQEWLQTGHVLPPKVLAALSQLKHEEVGYSLQDTFQSVGLNMSEKEVYDVWEKLKEFWWERFFSSAYLRYDVPYKSAVSFVKEVYALGAHVAYLTGREEEKMKPGTLTNLARDGFPLDPARTSLWMKQDPKDLDADYKRKTAERLEQKYQVIASFENEPHNVAALFDAFPTALHVFMDTVCSDKPAKALTGLVRISGYEGENS